MKSEQLEVIKTSCKDCIFAKYDQKTQIDCAANRIDIYRNRDLVVEAYDNDNEFFVIKGFCNYYRKKSWNNGEADLDKAKSEVAPSFDILIDCENLNADTQQTILRSLETLDYDNEKVKISLYYPVNMKKESISKTLEILCIYQPKYWTTVSAYFNKQEFLIDYFDHKLSATYFITINQNNYSTDFSMITAIHDYINADLKKVLILEKNNTLAILTNLFRFNKLKNNIYDIEENISSIISTTKETDMFISI